MSAEGWVALAAAVLNLGALAYGYGRLSQRVDVLWLAVFNHLGQDEEATRREWRDRRSSRFRGEGLR